MSEPLPVFFISHGAPTLAVEETLETRAWAELAAETPRPKAILAVSAHWDTDTPMLSGVAKPATIHDFNGFPKALYEQRYAAPGAPQLAELVAKQLAHAGLPCGIDPQRGLDHGAWVPLKWMYPQADIPVTQLSVQSRRGPRHHYALGQALAPLRKDGVLILCSGGIVHNLREIQWQAQMPEAWAQEFNDWMATRVLHSGLEDLLEYRKLAPSAERSHPTDEHLEPFFVALGAGGIEHARHVNLGMTMGTLGMDSFVFCPG